MGEKHLAADRLIVVVGTENEMVKRENIIGKHAYDYNSLNIKTNYIYLNT